MSPRESTLTDVLSRMLRVPDHWETFTAAYLDALDAAVDRDAAPSKRQYRSRSDLRSDRAEALAEWHKLVLDQLKDDDALKLLERLAAHHARAGPERTYLEAELAHRQGETARAQQLIGQCLDRLPGHEGFREAARRFGR